ncbi:putative membrane protein [Vibrio parahaemolyticus]|nr:putative membrane protein [Vibrio parahaemolyticus]
MNIFKRSAYATVSQLKRNQCTTTTLFCLFLAIFTPFYVFFYAIA